MRTWVDQVMCQNIPVQDRKFKSVVWIEHRGLAQNFQGPTGLTAALVWSHLQIRVSWLWKDLYNLLEKLPDPFNIRFKKHSNTTRWTLSAVGEHLRDTGHKLEESKAAVIAREENTFKRRIREALEILCQSPTFNWDGGFELPALYGDVLAHEWSTQVLVTDRFPPYSLE